MVHELGWGIRRVDQGHAHPAVYFDTHTVEDPHFAKLFAGV